MLPPWKESYDKPWQCFKKQKHHFVNKGRSSQSYGFSSSHVWMWELDHKEGWELKNWCFPTVVLEKILESPLDCKEIKSVNFKGNQAWIFIGRTDAEAPILWPPDAKSQLVGKDPDAGKDWRQEEKVMTEDEVVGWHHRLDGHEFEQPLGDGEGQESLACCSPWGRRVRHDWATEQQPGSVRCWYVLGVYHGQENRHRLPSWHKSVLKPHSSETWTVNHFTEENTELMLLWGMFPWTRWNEPDSSSISLDVEGTVTGRKRYREMGSRVGRCGPLPTAATLFSSEVGSRGETELCSGLSCSFKLRKAFYFAWLITIWNMQRSVPSPQDVSWGFICVREPPKGVPM